MTNLGDIYNQVVFLLGKDKVGNYVTPENFNEALKKINAEYLTMLVNEFERTKQVSNSLQNLIKTAGGYNNPPITLDAYGYGTIPSDYRYHARSGYFQFYNVTCTAEKKYRSVRFVSQAEFDHLMDIEMYIPTNEEPVFLFDDGKLRVYPILQGFQFTYIRQAATPVFDYDIIGGEAVYLPVGSVHVNADSGHPIGSESESVEFEFPLEDYPNLVNMLVRYFAIGNREDFNLKAQ